MLFDSLLSASWNERKGMKKKVAEKNLVWIVNTRKKGETRGLQKCHLNIREEILEPR